MSDIKDAKIIKMHSLPLRYSWLSVKFVVRKAERVTEKKVTDSKERARERSIIHPHISASVSHGFTHSRAIIPNI